MMKMTKNKTWSLLAALAAAGGTAQGALTITNGSFEVDGVGANQESITGWFEETSTADNSGEQALWEGTAANIPAAPDGEMWGHLITTRTGTQAIYQNVGTFNIGDLTSYTLTMTLGDRSNQAYPSIFIEFWSVNASEALLGGADGTTLANAYGSELLLASSEVTFGPESGASILSYSNTFNFNTANLEDGDTVWLRIREGTNNGHALFDNLQLTAVPEPAASCLALGAAGLLLRRRREA